MLEKLEILEVDEEDTSALRLKFPPSPRSGNYPVIMDGVGKSYGDKVVFRNATLTVERGDKVAFVGKNGEGKSTLVKCIMNEIKLLLEPVNLLILDEPTNHLDLKTKDILKQALKDFDGTLIVVSHDRDFLDGLVTKVYEFGNQKVTEHLCGIYEFLDKKKMDSLRELEK